MVAVALLAAGCSGVRVVTTGDPPVHTPTATSARPPLPPLNNAHLVDAFDYVAHVNNTAGYFFTTPSGKWRCAIVPRTKAGCSLEQPEFWLDPGPANKLQFNRILAVAGFRCNVQESGVSCVSEFTGKGFTFSSDGYELHYSDVPANAP